FSFFVEQAFQVLSNRTHQHLAPIFRTPDEVVFERENRACILTIPCVCHRTIVAHYSLSGEYLLSRRRKPTLPLSPKDDSPRVGKIYGKSASLKTKLLPTRTRA